MQEKLGNHLFMGDLQTPLSSRIYYHRQKVSATQSIYLSICLSMTLNSNVLVDRGLEVRNLFHPEKPIVEESALKYDPKDRRALQLSFAVSVC